MLPSTIRSKHSNSSQYLNRFYKFGVKKIDMRFSFIRSNHSAKVSSRVICLLLLITIIANSSTITIATFDTNAPIIGQKIHSNIIIDWNNLITELGIKEKLSPPEFARVYALVHVAMYDSLLAAATNREEYSATFDNKSFYVSSIAEAASTVLNYLFPNHSDEIDKLKSIQIGQAQNYDDNNLSIQSGQMLGHRVSQAVIDHAKTDNSNLLWNSTKTLPVKNQKCIWNGSNPINPMAGFWKTYILKSGSEVQPGIPTQCNSEADLQDVRETYDTSKNRTPKHNAAIHYWGDKPPPVVWNNILNQHIQKYNMSILQVAYSSVYLNVGMYDGFVSCWYTKYNYWTARPFQRIGNITTEIPTPNFPGYTSGHSVISMVASRVLGEIFPDERDYFKGQAIEAALSRLLAGIHFKQDIINGIDQGDKVAEKVVDDMHKPIHPFIYGS